MNLPLVVAGALALLGALVHGVGGEALVVRRLPSTGLPSTTFGGPSFTKVMIRFTWHVTTLAFLALGSGMVTCGASPNTNGCGGVGLTGAISFTAFGVLAVALGSRRHLHVFGRHPGPLLFVVAAALAWWGAVS